MSFDIRAPRPEELPWLAEQLGAAYQASLEQEIGAPRTEAEITVELGVRQPVLGYTGNGPVHLLIIEDTVTKTLAGGVLMVHVPALNSTSANFMWVQPEYRNRVPIRRVIRAGIDLARRNGSARLDLGVVAVNPALRRVYELSGFKPYSVVMSKRLS